MGFDVNINTFIPYGQYFSITSENLKNVGILITDNSIKLNDSISLKSILCSNNGKPYFVSKMTTQKLVLNSLMPVTNTTVSTFRPNSTISLTTPLTTLIQTTKQNQTILENIPSVINCTVTYPNVSGMFAVDCKYFSEY